MESKKVVLILDSSGPLPRAAISDDGRIATLEVCQSGTPGRDPAVEIVCRLFERARRSVNSVCEIRGVEGAGSVTGWRVLSAFGEGLGSALGVEFVRLSQIDLVLSCERKWDEGVSIVVRGKKSPLAAHIDKRGTIRYSQLVEHGVETGTTGRLIWTREAADEWPNFGPMDVLTHSLMELAAKTDKRVR